MVFVSERQRRAFFVTGNFKRAPMQPNIVAFSYFTGKRLGRFKNLKEVFNRFPKEKKAFQRVIRFRKQTGIRVNTIEDIKRAKRKQKIMKRWDR